mmetsp:Transcript_47330/g.76266  ORF Transcript_47330/g.76266 Transcript_47330/m.76266 type:complete len:267 (+) Transcript_47330:55-855(+)
MSTKLTGVENASMGLLGGGIEVSLLQGMNYLKNASQQGLPFTLNPRVLYRGYPSNLLNMGSGTMWQFAVCGQMGKMLTKGDKRPLKPWEDVTAGFIAGTSSGVLVSPLELIMIQQQLKGGSAMGAVQKMGGVTALARGFVPGAIREGLWSVGYLSLPPIIRNYLKSNYASTFSNETQIRSVAALLGAFISCIASHPFDTVKTCMQGDIEQKRYKTMTHTFRELFSESGVTRFYRGLPWRYGRQFLAVFILDQVREDVTPYLFPHAA